MNTNSQPTVASVSLEDQAGAAALNIGEKPSNNAVDTDNVMLDDPKVDSDGDPISEEDQKKLDEARMLDEAEAILDGEVAQESWMPSSKPRGFLDAFSQLAKRHNFSLEEQLQANVELSEALLAMEQIAADIPCVSTYARTVEDLELVVEPNSVLTQTEATLAEVVNRAMALGFEPTDADVVVNPALESQEKSGDRKGFIRRILDKILEMVRKFWVWLKSFRLASDKVIEQEEGRMEVLKDKWLTAKQSNAPRATMLPPFQIPPLILSDSKSGITPTDVASGIVTFRQEFSKLLEVIDTEMKSLVGLMEYVELGRPLTQARLKPATAPTKITVFPGRTIFEVLWSREAQAEEELSLAQAADVLKDAEYNCLQIGPDDMEKVVVPPLNTVEALMQGYTKVNQERLDKIKAFYKRLDALDLITEDLEKRISGHRNSENWEQVLFLSDYLACVLRFQSASRRSVSLAGANYSRWMNEYLTSALSAHSGAD